MTEAALDSVPVRGSDDECALYCDENEVGVGEAALGSSVGERRLLPGMIAGVARKGGDLCAERDLASEKGERSMT